MRSFILIAGAALALAACQPQPSDVQTNSNVAVSNTSIAAQSSHDCGLASNTTADEKALFVAETAYNIPAHAYVTLDGTGKLPANIKVIVKPKLIQLYSYLKLARSAYNAGDGCSLKTYSDLAKALGDQVNGILPRP